MPKIIDHEQRRMAIADAVFDALREGGFENVTLSSVAARAHLAIGSVRHFLGTHEQMVGFAFDTMAERIRDRVVVRAEEVLSGLEDGTLDTDHRLTATTDILCQFLPLDSARRDEAIVWIEFETAARTNSHLAETSKRATSQMTQLIETVLATAAQHGTLPASIDLSTETARLAALIDGLTLRATLHPDILDPDLARQAVITHLQELRRQPEARVDA